MSVCEIGVTRDFTKREKVYCISNLKIYRLMWLTQLKSIVKKGLTVVTMYYLRWLEILLERLPNF